MSRWVAHATQFCEHFLRRHESVRFERRFACVCSPALFSLNRMFATGGALSRYFVYSCTSDASCRSLALSEPSQPGRTLTRTTVSVCYIYLSIYIYITRPCCASKHTTEQHYQKKLASAGCMFQSDKSIRSVLLGSLTLCWLSFFFARLSAAISAATAIFSSLILVRVSVLSRI